MSKRKHCQMDSVSDLMTLEPKVSDSMKLMFLAYRAEMIYLCDVNLEYDYYWRDYADSLTHPDRPGPLTRPIEETDEDDRSLAIKRLLKRRRLDDAFDCAIGFYTFYLSFYL